MQARPILFLIASLYSSFILNVSNRSVDASLFERRYKTSDLMFNAPGGQLPSMSHCATLCDRSPSCKAFCYSRSTALCHLSQPYEPIVQVYDISDSMCYNPIGCPITKGYAWYGARCIKGYMQYVMYATARAICTQDGGHLYHFKDLEWDLQPIVYLRADINLDVVPWVGADALETDGQFKWSDSSLFANGSSLWRSGYPVGNPSNRCVRLYVTEKGLFNGRCDNYRHFVCQIGV